MFFNVLLSLCVAIYLIVFSSRESTESYSLSSGFALGLVTLGTGNPGGNGNSKEEPNRGFDLPGSHAPTLPIEQRLQRFVTGGRTMENQDSSEGCVLTGSAINTNVTAPGATIALALCFLKSNNVEVQTPFLFDIIIHLVTPPSCYMAHISRLLGA